MSKYNSVEGSNVSTIYSLSILGLSSLVILIIIGFLKSLNLRKFDLDREILSNDLKFILILGLYYQFYLVT